MGEIRVSYCMGGNQGFILYGGISGFHIVWGTIRVSYCMGEIRVSYYMGGNQGFILYGGNQGFILYGGKSGFHIVWGEIRVSYCMGENQGFILYGEIIGGQTCINFSGGGNQIQAEPNTSSTHPLPLHKTKIAICS